MGIFVRDWILLIKIVDILSHLPKQCFGIDWVQSGIYTSRIRQDQALKIKNFLRTLNSTTVSKHIEHVNNNNTCHGRA